MGGRLSETPGCGEPGTAGKQGVLWGVLYLTRFLQSGRDHAAPEVAAGVVVLLRIVRRNRRPELGLQVLVVAGHGAQGHAVQDEAPLQPQRALAHVHHPSRSRPGPRWREWEAPGRGALRIVTWPQRPCDIVSPSHPVGPEGCGGRCVPGPAG